MLMQLCYPVTAGFTPKHRFQIATLEERERSVKCEVKSDDAYFHLQN